MMFENASHFTMKMNDRGVCHVVMDVSGRPMNVLDRAVMEELEQIVSRLESADGIRLCVFSSGKESGFLAGADVSEIQRISSADEAQRLLRRGQELFARIASLPMKTLAVIHGPCLGGGLELALACSYRIARNNSSTRIGLPEIKLGLIPGWGGTQRLPKLIGVKGALKLILTGKSLGASDAKRFGLVDRSIEPDEWRDEVAKTIDRLSQSDSHLKRHRRHGWRTWLVESNPISRMLLFAAARKRVENKATHYPAVLAAIRAIEASFDPSRDGYEEERHEFGLLVGTSTSRQLLNLFFSREAARKLSTWSPDTLQTIHHAPIQEVGIIGAGAMGVGIGHAAATRGYEVALKEINMDLVAQGRERLDGLIADHARHKRLNAAQVELLRKRTCVTDEWSQLSDSDLVVEAVVERMDVKKQVLAHVERNVSQSAVLATNTSSLSVTEMASHLTHPERFAGLHFFNPVHRMELVEVVRGEKTDPATIAKLVSFVRALGKTPIVTKDSPGFLVNRLLFPYLGEAVLMASEGHNIKAIDLSIREFGMPMGPLELLDQVGLDVALHVAGSLRAVMPELEIVIDTLSPMVRRGEIGRKSGIGFYAYGGKRNVPLPLTTATVPDQTESGCENDGLTDLQRRLIYPILAEAMRCDKQSVVAEPWMIDLGMVLGTGFAPHRGGPMSMIESIGRAKVRFNLHRLVDRHGSRFAPPKPPKTYSH